MQGDKLVTDAAGQGYAPVAWPGFSWANLKGQPALLNQIPRLGGTFFWHQVAKLVDLGPQFLYVAMYDEVDEGTAMFKAAATVAEVPVSPGFLYLGIDGVALPSNWYLRLGGAAGRALRGWSGPVEPLPFAP